ncbi:hypothetical protein [Dyadobacter arcticus]|nr:hypothetical protein [Dyadobacter arcticus]
MFMPILIWVFVIFYYSVNLPWYDDFDPFPDFLHKWMIDTDLSNRMHLLFQPNNEHRMVVGKLVTLIYYWTTGQLNFTFLHIAGGIFTLGTLILFWRAFEKSRLSWWYFLPVPFLLFQLQFHLAFLWAICGLQHPPVVFFATLSMFLLARNRFGWAALAGVCATYAMSSGIFVWPAGIVVLLIGSHYKQLIVWCVAAVFAVGFYFYGLSAQGNESSVTFLIQNPHLPVLGFFAFLGGLFDFFPEKPILVRSVLPVIMGFLVMIWVVIWLVRQIMPWLKYTLNWPKQSPKWSQQQSEGSLEVKTFRVFLVGILTFLLVDALVIGLLRTRFGFFVMIVSNYKIYPALFLTIAYLAFISSATRDNVRKLGFRISVVTSILIWGISMYSYLPVISERQKYYTVNGYNQEFNGYGLGHVPYSESAAYVDILMKDMVRRGIYRYPPIGEQLASMAALLQTDISGSKEFRVEDRDSVYYVKADNRSLSYAKDNIQCVFVRNQERLYLFKLEPFKYSGRNIFRQYDKGSDVLIPYLSLLPGTYDLGVMNALDGKVEGGILRKVTVPMDN